MTDTPFIPTAVDAGDQPQRWTIRPIVAGDGTGTIGFTWGNETGVMQLDEARDFAVLLLAMAEAVELEAAFYRYLRRDPNATDEKVGGILLSFRRWRAAEAAAVDETGVAGGSQ